MSDDPCLTCDCRHIRHCKKHEPLVVLPNLALQGNELLLLSMQSAKQTLYAEKRRRHSEAWFKFNVEHERQVHNARIMLAWIRRVAL